MLVDLQKITTRDGVGLHGGVVWPERKGKIALVLLHGLCGSSYAWFERMEPLIALCRKEGIAVASFSTRGSNVVQSLYKAKKKFLGGGAFEKFEDSVHDIRAAIDFLSTNGYRQIVLVGQSTGANKAVYYIYKTKDRRVKKLLLLVPLSDIVGEIQTRGRLQKKLLEKARIQVRRGKGDELFMETYPERLWSAKRYLSLYTSGSAEDIFPYYNSKGNWRAVESIRVPTLVVLGDRDQYLDRDVGEVMEAFQKHVRYFRGTIIAGADHSFNKREKQLARVVVQFITA